MTEKALFGDVRITVEQTKRPVYTTGLAQPIWHVSGPKYIDATIEVVRECTFKDVINVIRAAYHSLATTVQGDAVEAYNFMVGCECIMCKEVDITIAAVYLQQPIPAYSEVDIRIAEAYNKAYVKDISIRHDHTNKYFK